MEEPMNKQLFAVLAILLAGVVVYGSVNAQDDPGSPVASPEGVEGLIRLVLIERDSVSTELDFGEEGPSAGDMDIWGPNPFYDETNSTETGITTQGTCTLLHDLSTCLASETIVFQDGSSIVIQGVQTDPSDPTVRPIVGGSGQWLGATGTMTVEANEDRTVWTKTLEIWL
jgi:hypothetical protein